MRTLGSLLTLGIFALAVGCGDSSSGGGTGGSGGQGGNVSIDAGGGIGGGGIDATMTGGIDAPATGGIDAPATSGIDAPPVIADIDAGIAACNLPACVASVLTTCQPAGTCVKQQILTPLGSASCFSNGVKVIQGTDLATGQMVVTYKNAATTCYSITVVLGTPVGFTIKDAAGVALGAGTVDLTTSAMSFSCSNGAPVVLNPSCNLTTLIMASGATAACTDGVCTP